MPGAWLIDRDGHTTNDPRILAGGGSILPLGGLDLGYKGFAFALIVEALTNALAGHGRADEESRWGASVFLQIIDPERFGGRAAFLRETSFFAQFCRETPAPSGESLVRLPGSSRTRAAQGTTRHRRRAASDNYAGIGSMGERVGSATAGTSRKQKREPAAALNDSRTLTFKLFENRKPRRAFLRLKPQSSHALGHSLEIEALLKVQDHFRMVFHAFAQDLELGSVFRHTFQVRSKCVDEPGLASE